MDDSISYLKRTKPIPGGETEEEYRSVMRKIMQGLTKENLEIILFLCKDHIPHGREITTSLQLLQYLEDRDLVSQNSAVFIAEVLHIIRRMDLLKLIPCIKNKTHFEKEFLALSYSSFSNYRVLTVKLQEELSQRDFETFRHQCGQHLNIRTLDTATSVLSLLCKLEEEDVISPESYDDLITILQCIENVKPLKMFQRLLDGDESVAVPAGKLSQLTSRSVDPNGSFIPPRDGQRSNSTRVEHNPNEHVLPHDFRAYSGSQENDVFGTKEKRIDDEKAVRYDFTQGHFTLTSQNERWFEGDEVTPKSVVNPRPCSNVPYQSMPPPYVVRDHQRHHTESSVASMPFAYPASPPHYEDTFRPMPHPASYPLFHHQGHYYAQGMPRYNYPVQQQQSCDGPRRLEHRYQPHCHLAPGPNRQISSMPPPSHYQTPHMEASLRDMSLVSGKNEEKLNEGSFILDEDDTLPNKATVGLSAEIQEEPKQARLSPEHERQMEELRKRNEELEKLIAEQRTVGSYAMDASPVGKCVLINNVKFKENRKVEEYNRRQDVNSRMKNPSEKYPLPRIDLCDRVGSNIDADKLEKLFTCFDFEIHRYDDLDERAIRRVVLEMGSADHTNYDCFLLIILSHGDMGCVFGVDGFPVEITSLQKPFFANNCKSLADKPKIFFFQSCQGRKTMLSVTPEADLVHHDGPQPENQIDNSTPDKADFLLAYSTVPGYKSYRSRIGSFFVMEMVDIFRKHYQTQDLLSMMIMVNDEVGKYSHKQVPLPMPTLRRKVFFHLKEGCTLDDLDNGEIEELLGEAQRSISSLGAVGGSLSVPVPEERQSTPESGEQND